VTPEAKARRLALAEAFQLKALQCAREHQAGLKRPSHGGSRRGGIASGGLSPAA
jgi:hypothetical protein